MRNTSLDVEMKDLRNWLENEEEINKEYNELEIALEELDDIFFSESGDDEEVEVNSTELTTRGYRWFSRNKIRKTGIQETLEEFKDELREQILIMDLYNEVKYGSQEVIGEQVFQNKFGTFAVTTEEFRKGDLRLRVIHEYELVLNEEHKNALSQMTKDEKYGYIIENGEYII